MKTSQPQCGPQAIAGSIQLWIDDNFMGNNISLSTRVGDCVPFPEGFRDDVSSVAPLSAWQCKLFT